MRNGYRGWRWDDIWRVTAIRLKMQSISQRKTLKECWHGWLGAVRFWTQFGDFSTKPHLLISSVSFASTIPSLLVVTETAKSSLQGFFSAKKWLKYEFSYIIQTFMTTGLSGYFKGCVEHSYSFFSSCSFFFSHLFFSFPSPSFLFFFLF